jgi:NADH-quinone oxidoreductase subunit E
MEHVLADSPCVVDIGELEERIASALGDFEGKPYELIPMLQSVQRELGYLPEEALLEIARLTKQPTARVFGVATFYAQFRFQPVGRYIIKICRGTACHVSGSDLILEDLEAYLGIATGETTSDRLFTLETVACFGSCALAPVIVINDSVYGLMNPSKTRRLLDKLRREEIPTGSEGETVRAEG